MPAANVPFPPDSTPHLWHVPWHLPELPPAKGSDNPPVPVQESASTRSTMPFRSRSVFSCCAANALAAALPPSSISPRSRCSLPIYVCPNSSAACIASFMARIALPVKPSVYRMLPFLSAVCSHFISFERDKYSIFFLQDLSKQSHFSPRAYDVL